MRGAVASLRWTSSDSPALTSTGSSCHVRAVVSPVNAAALLLERNSHHDDAPRSRPELPQSEQALATLT